MAVHRILKEIADISVKREAAEAADEVLPWTAEPAGDDLFRWDAIVIGPEDSPYEGARFKLAIQFSEDYPFSPPKVLFTTVPYHPGVHPDGRLCLRELQLVKDGGMWDPTATISHIMGLILSMLADPESVLDHPLVPEIASQLSTNKAAFIQYAKEHTAALAADDA